MILFVNRKQLFWQQCHDTRHIYQSNTIQWIAVHGQSNSNKYTILIKDVVQIIIDFNFNLGSPSCVESEVNDESRSGNKLPKTKNLFVYLSMKVMCIIDVRNLFSSLHQHALDTTPVNAEIHSVSLVKLLVFRFFKVRCLSYLKLLNSKNTEETSIRNSVLKQFQFKGL